MPFYRNDLHHSQPFFAVIHRSSTLPEVIYLPHKDLERAPSSVALQTGLNGAEPTA